jgi:uncharacterized integral membrane protein
MPWRLISFIVLFGIFVVFIAFNLGNTCNINLLFHTFSDVPVFLTVLVSYALGMFCSLPFVISLALKKKNKAPKEPSLSGKPAAAKKKAGKKIEDAYLEGGDNGPYGIN